MIALYGRYYILYTKHYFCSTAHALDILRVYILIVSIDKSELHLHVCTYRLRSDQYGSMSTNRKYPLFN